MRWGTCIALVALVAATACSRPAPEPRRYELRGQIVGVDPARKEVVVDHEDIPGFMPAMVMPYSVEDASLLEGKKPGDLVTATLVVEEVKAYLTSINTTGNAPLRSDVATPLVSDADLLKDGELVPDDALVDETGAPFTMASLRGHRVALTFIYSRCPLPDYCPLMDRHFADVQRTVRTTPALADVRLVSVTIDPAFDRPPVLAQHAKTVGAEPQVWHFATGDPEIVMAFAKRFGVIAEAGETATALVHNLRTAVIDADGRLVKAYSGNMWTPTELIADLTATPAPQS